MSGTKLEYNVEIYPGSPAQVNVGILAKAKLTLNINGEALAAFDDIYIRAKKDNGGAWVCWPARPDPRGKTDEKTGRVIQYPLYKIFPADLNKRKQVEEMILREYSGTSSKSKTNSSKPSTPTPTVNKKEPVPAPVVDDDLDFSV